MTNRSLAFFEIDDLILAWQRKGNDPDAVERRIAARSALERKIARIAAPTDPWKEAIINEGVVCEIGWDEDSATKSLHDIINWHIAVALDPAVSSAAQALIERGRQEAWAQAAADAETKRLEGMR